MSENALSMFVLLICASQYAFVPTGKNVCPFRLNRWPDVLTKPVAPLAGAVVLLDGDTVEDEVFVVVVGGTVTVVVEDFELEPGKHWL
jgi:hypothetical protein